MKAVVENSPRITIRQLREHQDWQQFLAAGAVDLTLQAGKVSRTVRVDLDSDRMPRGGVRYWLRCPRCSSLRHHLYLVGGRLLCRGPRCNRLYYYTQTLPDSFARPEWLAILKAWNRCRRATSTMDPQQAIL